MGVKDKDNGMRALQARLADLKEGDGWTLKVGVLTSDQKVNHEGVEQPVTLADVAAIHEYGLGVPQRSFIGAWFDENTTDLRARAAREVASYLRGDRTKDEIMARLGSYCVGEIQARIAEGIPPELSLATILRKGSSVPLIDTGQLRTGITFATK